MKTLDQICKPCEDSRKEIAQLREEIQKLTKKISIAEMTEKPRVCSCETPIFVNNKSMPSGVICLDCGGGRCVNS